VGGIIRIVAAPPVIAVRDLRPYGSPGTAVELKRCVAPCQMGHCDEYTASPGRENEGSGGQTLWRG
jgi:hypothetical protein